MHMLWILAVIAALSQGPAQSTKARGTVDRGKDERRHARPGRPEASPAAGKGKQFHPLPAVGKAVAADGNVSARLDAASTVYLDDGRWTDSPDGIYLEETEDAIYGIVSWHAPALAPEDTAALASATARVFAEFRRYADAACPVSLRRRIEDDEVLRATLEAEYEHAREAARQRTGRTLAFEQFLEQSPDCEVEGNLWRTSTRFAAYRADRQDVRLLVRFPGSIAVRPFLRAAHGENYLSLLKDHLRRQNKLIHAPLRSRTP